MTARRTTVCAALVVCGLASSIAAWRSIRAVGESAASAKHVALATGSERVPQSRARTVVSTGRLPLLFEKNQGQSDGSVAFLSRGLDCYPIVVLAATPSDGVQAVKALSSWVTDLGRIRISWVKTPSVNDASNGTFVIR